MMENDVGRSGAEAPSGSQATPGAAEASPPSVSIPNAQIDAENAVRLGTLYQEIQAEQYACSKIVCVFPLDGNCWCFNTALARHVEQAIDDADESCKHGYANWRDCVACTIRDKIARGKAASAMSAGTAETPQAAQGEARQRDGCEDSRDAQTP